MASLDDAAAYPIAILMCAAAPRTMPRAAAEEGRRRGR